MAEAEDSNDEEKEDFIEPEHNVENEEDFLPQFHSFSQRTFDCTEEAIEISYGVKFTDNLKLFLGQEWNTTDLCRTHLRMYGIKKKFEIKFKKNCSNKLICICKAKSCPWRCYIRRLNDGHTMVRNGLEDRHTCENDGQNKNSMANGKWIAKMIEQDMRMYHTCFTEGIL